MKTRNQRENGTWDTIRCASSSQHFYVMEGVRCEESSDQDFSINFFLVHYFLFFCWFFSAKIFICIYIKFVLINTAKYLSTKQPPKRMESEEEGNMEIQSSGEHIGMGKCRRRDII